MTDLRLCVACRTGDKATAEGILAEARGNALALIRESNALGEACAGGALEVARWLTTFGLTPKDARALDGVALRWVCHGRHIECAQWLVDTFGLTTEDARALDCVVLWWAAACGHLDVVEWLMKTFRDFTVADCNIALVAACTAGHHSVAALLKPAATKAGARLALCAACSSGFLETARWIVAEFSLSAADVHGMTLSAARHNGHHDVVMWLTTWLAS